MTTGGCLEVVDVNGIVFTDDGKSLRLEFVETIPPYATSFILFRNVLVTKLYRADGDEFPLTVVDLSWHAVADADLEQVLALGGFPFFDALGRPRVPQVPLVIAHLEGDLSGEVIAEDVDLSR